MKELARQIYLQRAVLLTNIIVCLIVSALLLIFSRRYEWKKDKVSLFSFLFNLNERQLVAVGLIVTRFIYTFVLMIIKNDLNIGYLIVYLVYGLLLTYLNQNFKGLAFETLYGIVAYGTIFLERYLINYYTQVTRSGIYVVLVLVITIFITLLSFLKIITSYEMIIENRKK